MCCVALCTCKFTVASYRRFCIDSGYVLQAVLVVLWSLPLLLWWILPHMYTYHYYTILVTRPKLKSKHSILDK